MSYLFKAGEKTKLKTFSAYTSREINPWTWLIVKEVAGNQALVALQENPDRVFPVALSDLEAPLGYQESYDVIVPSREKAVMVTSWLVSRSGITVWASHDLSTAGRYMFTPGDKVSEGKPHWSVGLVETVTDSKRIRILVTEVSTEKKTEKQKREGWKYDRCMREWYRDIPYTPDSEGKGE
jgi:hypothetical protein